MNLCIRRKILSKSFDFTIIYLHRGYIENCYSFTNNYCNVTISISKFMVFNQIIQMETTRDESSICGLLKSLCMLIEIALLNIKL